MKREKDIWLLSPRFIKPELMEAHLDKKRNVNLVLNMLHSMKCCVG
jgi:hypothetical protein